VTKLPNVAWSRLGAEAIVIIFSVLVALALDDWRDARAERALEHYLMVSLKEDLTADLAELDSVLKSAKAVECADIGWSGLNSTRSHRLPYRSSNTATVP